MITSTLIGSFPCGADMIYAVYHHVIFFFFDLGHFELHFRFEFPWDIPSWEEIGLVFKNLFELHLSPEKFLESARRLMGLNLFLGCCKLVVVAGNAMQTTVFRAIYTISTIVGTIFACRHCCKTLSLKDHLLQIEKQRDYLNLK